MRLPALLFLRDFLWVLILLATPRLRVSVCLETLAAHQLINSYAVSLQAGKTQRGPNDSVLSDSLSGWSALLPHEALFSSSHTIHWPWYVPPGFQRKNMRQAVYSSELLSAKRGTAIFSPFALERTARGSPEQIGIGIGDVGYMHNSIFHPLFRASEGPEVPEERRLNDLLPDDFVPIEVGEVESGSYPAGIQCVRNLDTSVITDGGNSSSLVKEGTVIRFVPTQTRGAALFTKYRVWRYDVADEKPFVDYILKNHKSWVKFCIYYFGRADLLFVTGADVSTYYTTMAYHPRAPIETSTDLIVTDSAWKAQMKMSNGTYRAWAWFTGPVLHNAGPIPRMKPDAETDNYLQHLEEQHDTIAASTLFIRALRLQRRRIFSFEIAKWTREMIYPWVQYGPYVDLDPLQPLADYIFSHSIAWFALFGDNDIKQLLGDLRPNEDLRGLLKRLRPRVRWAALTQRFRFLRVGTLHKKSDKLLDRCV
ncbi:hypothetical protein DFH06DRAFT_1328388 [Mycena polygramma]|nr:hypothetical protein DFH06DRAFT_1328388 [Mycena polygramma]